MPFAATDPPHFHSHGTGRDSYIGFNNGGLYGVVQKHKTFESTFRTWERPGPPKKKLAGLNSKPSPAALLTARKQRSAMKRLTAVPKHQTGRVLENQERRAYLTARLNNPGPVSLPALPDARGYGSPETTAAVTSVYLSDGSPGPDYGTASMPNLRGVSKKRTARLVKQRARAMRIKHAIDSREHYLKAQMTARLTQRGRRRRKQGSPSKLPKLDMGSVGVVGAMRDALSEMSNAPKLAALAPQTEGQGAGLVTVKVGPNSGGIVAYSAPYEDAIIGTLVQTSNGTRLLKKL